MLTALIVLSSLTGRQLSSQLPPRSVYNLDLNWKFALGNADIRSKDFGYGTLGQDSKPGYPDGPPSPDFSDSSWRTVNVPHDWVVELPFVPDGKADVGHGSKPVGRDFPATSIGWYRKTFSTPKMNPGDKLKVRFDGVFQDATFWVNGIRIEHHLSGYLPTSFDITDFVHQTRPNTLVVRVNATRGSGWFYEGAGIYRHVWLFRKNAIHIAEFNPAVDSKVIGNKAEVTVDTLVRNQSDKNQEVVASTVVIAPSGSQALGHTADASAEVLVPAGSSRHIITKMLVSKPELWSINHPNLYSVNTVLGSNGHILDSKISQFGIRTIKFTANDGFFLNGKRVELKGACDHQDAAGVGIGVSDDLDIYRIKQLKMYGFNALRTSHNAPDPALLAACDKLGFLVMDENRTFDSGATDKKDLATMVKRDRNHPSVIMWSIGNEEPLNPTLIGKAMALTLMHVIHKHDVTRPISMASNQGNAWDGANSVLNLRGWNYISNGDTDLYHKLHPNQPMYGSEEASTVTDRGEYVTDPKKGYMSGYDANQPGWGSLAEGWWNYYEPRKYLAGAFVWTGFDYRGEPTPYGWPCISSHFGVLDTCGFPKDVAYYYKAWWTKQPMVHLAPTWNWPGDKGKDKLVWIESNCQQVDLKLNGKDLGTKQVIKLHHLEWQVPYEPGTLEAFGINHGKVVCEDKQVTCGPVYKLSATPSATQVVADGEHNIIVNVAALDANDNPATNASEEVHFSLSSDNASIIGVGNGDPSCHEPDVYVQKPVRLPIGDWQMASVDNATQPMGVLPDGIKLSWSPVEVLSDAQQISQPNTAAVFKADFNLSDKQTGMKLLSIGQIDDVGDVFINGHFLGHTDHWDESYNFPVSEYLKPGKNEILVWVHNIGGGGGLGKGVSLSSPGNPPQWKRSFFHGLCQVIIRAGTSPGPVVLHIVDANGVATDVPLNMVLGASLPRL